jgi:hypothetical protein
MSVSVFFFDYCYIWATGAGAVNLRPTVSQLVCPGVRRPFGTCDKFFFILEISFRQLRVCNFVAPSLTRGRVLKLLYHCFWALPEQSLLGQSPAELTAILDKVKVTLRPTISRPCCQAPIWDPQPIFLSP